MSVINKFMNYFGLQEEEEITERERVSTNDDQEVETNPFESRKQSRNQQFSNVGNNVVSLHTQKNTRMVLCEPKSYDEAQAIADEIRNRKSVVVNLQRVQSELGLRIVDFLSGTVYALSGSISKLGPNIYLCAPETVEVQGSITELAHFDR
ncbi:cell division protein SepF [Paenibacillus endoradicis]|uniref:cell division protein SepF n=1 Tax=Paenibacillus endoradicis TaxID=2972487 RepID=UPI0021591959|nr:cell division protein SepF [Paenibacillus endoradicis]MCR8656015.1 cell division protein SepF [Paenibacillus endoradicis]MCR8658341.1 cell division protein SepF [Paenibacillus endoradicis]